MSDLAGKTVAVIGGSRGVGRRIVEAAVAAGAEVLAAARQDAPLRQLTDEIRGVHVLALDAAVEAAPSRVFERAVPDILVLSGGALPPVSPLYEQSWQQFSVNWESDVKMAFHFCKAALTRPLSLGSSVILIASGAGLAGSPISGGYAGAKRMQMFMAGYGQKESDRLGLGLRFMAVAPRIMPETALGQHAVAGYSRYLGMPAADFVKSMGQSATPADLAREVIGWAIDPDRVRGTVFTMSGHGLEAVPA